MNSIIWLLLLLLVAGHCAANLLSRKTPHAYDRPRLAPEPASSTLSINTSVPLRNFQLAVPPSIDANAKSCSIELVHHVFANSWGKPANAKYEPPTTCGDIHDWQTIVLNYTATSNGTQYDRLSSVYLSHVEILRTSTSEPTRGAGIVCLKDVTHYAPLFAEPGSILVDLGNGIDISVGLDGEFDVTLSVTFYSTHQKQDCEAARHPDAIIPLSTRGDSQANYFSVDEDGVGGSTLVKLPATSTKALVEIYASGNAREEFWYTNPPDSLLPYLGEDTLAKGPFREVQLLVDDKLAGLVWPFSVIFSGGIVPTAWRPMIAYGAFDQPTYQLDITPFLPLIAGKIVNITLVVKGQGAHQSIYSNWFVSGNIKVWTDAKQRQVHGRLLEHHAPAGQQETVAHVDDSGHSAMAFSLAKRRLNIVSEICHEKDCTLSKFTQDLAFENVQRYTHEGGKQKVLQDVHVRTESWRGGEPVLSDHFDFPLKVEADYSRSDGFSASIALGYRRNVSGTLTHVAQKAQGAVYLNKIGRVVNGTGSAKGSILYHEPDGHTYTRRVATRGIDVVYDKEGFWHARRSEEMYKILLYAENV